MASSSIYGGTFNLIAVTLAKMGITATFVSPDASEEELNAAFHHEKLNGKGYPFGKTAAELNEPERIMACIDIYQALTESRPYKHGFSHEKTCDILDDMADKGFIDAGIAQNIRVCFQDTMI